MTHGLQIYRLLEPVFVVDSWLVLCKCMDGQSCTYRFLTLFRCLPSKEMVLVHYDFTVGFEPKHESVKAKTCYGEFLQVLDK